MENKPFSWWDIVRNYKNCLKNDPFQVFEVEHDSCMDLKIQVRKGENITKGSVVQDLCDTPDPYVVLRVPGSSNCSKRTSHIDNTVHPIWNETFHFFLDPKEQHTLYVLLMDANVIMNDETLGENILDINSLPLNDPRDFIVEYPGGSKIHLTLTYEQNKTPDLRFSLALCEEEKKFLRLRREKVMKQMQNLLGEKGPKMEAEVPVVAILGSGGGFRAMTCLSGAVKALHENHILACAMYIAGLSGSSWLISYLYSHDKFPSVTYDEIYDELLESVTQNWKWNIAHGHRYILDMIQKYRGGQPVSFTDIFGHLLGDVLLHGKKHKKLTDQRAIVEKGNVPFPLYTCLHAKASVSCKSFSEWIEFSPYEIGIAKYGTFMKTEDFGSKFIVGKLIKKYNEFPLHYLQGVWGSAFTILMRRLVLSGGSKQDLVQMMREANEERSLNEKLEEEYLDQASEECEIEKESETDDEADVEGADDKLHPKSFPNEKTVEAQLEEIKRELNSNSEKNIEKPKKETVAAAEKTTGSPKKPKKNKFMKASSFDFSKVLLRKGSKEEKDEKRKISLQINPETYQELTHVAVKKNRLIRQDAKKKGCSSQAADIKSDYWQQKREEREKNRTKKSSLIQSLMQTSNILNSRVGRAGEILNPFRGLSLRHSFPLSPFETSTEEEEDADEVDVGPRCRYESLDNKAKKLFIVDSGLAFNSPFPLLLRPQRAVDIYLSFDFSQRPSDSHMPFKELLIAEKWAIQNKVPFPPIEKLAEEFSKDPEVKEFYIFKDEKDSYCPVIIHFTIVNNKFKWEKEPGVQRETAEERNFADFSLFDDPAQPYASTNFIFEPIQYERLVKLVEYNTLLGIDTIKEEIALCVEKKRKLALSSVDTTFQKVRELLKACNKFKRTEGMHLKVDKKESFKYLNMWKRGNSKKISTSSNFSSSFEDAEFYDAEENFLDDFDEETDCEETDSDEDQENGIPIPNGNLPEKSNKDQENGIPIPNGNLPEKSDEDQENGIPIPNSNLPEKSDEDQENRIPIPNGNLPAKSDEYKENGILTPNGNLPEKSDLSSSLHKMTLS